MPFKAPAYAAPASSWTGFYIGVNGGAGWATAASSIDLAGLAAGLGGLGTLGNFPVGSHEINGFLGGGQIGYNWQTGNIVLGVEGDGDWADVEGTAPCIEVLSCSAKVNWTADATVRLGVLPMSNVLIYVKGGAAWAGLNYNLSSAGVLGAGTSLSSGLTTTKTGGLLGLGTEYLFAPHWTAKIEYNYADFGSHTDTFVLSETGVGSVAVPIQTTLQMHTVKAGVNYHF
ncbi:MAG: outer membrane beta-barrel protein [Xanthobacteraceae bacterium]